MNTNRLGNLQHVRREDEIGLTWCGLLVNLADSYTVENPIVGVGTTGIATYPEHPYLTEYTLCPVCDKLYVEGGQPVA